MSNSWIGKKYLILLLDSVCICLLFLSYDFILRFGSAVCLFLWSFYCPFNCFYFRFRCLTSPFLPSPRALPASCLICRCIFWVLAQSINIWALWNTFPLAPFGVCLVLVLFFGSASLSFNRFWCLLFSFCFIRPLELWMTGSGTSWFIGFMAFCISLKDQKK